MNEEKPNSGLWRYEKEIQGGKYLVLRRDGTVFDEPNFVLGKKDPATPKALRAYAEECQRIMLEDGDNSRFNVEYIADVLKLAVEIEKFQETAKESGDPGKGQHRKDNPRVIEQIMNPDRIILAKNINDPEGIVTSLQNKEPSDREVDYKLELKVPIVVSIEKGGNVFSAEHARNQQLGMVEVGYGKDVSDAIADLCQEIVDRYAMYRGSSPKAVTHALSDWGKVYWKHLQEIIEEIPK